MASLQEKLEKVLRKELRAETDLESLPNGHVCGHVISPEFKGKSSEYRRKRIRKILEKHMKRDELISVGTLLAYTPEEWSFEPTES